MQLLETFLLVNLGLFHMHGNRHFMFGEMMIRFDLFCHTLSTVEGRAFPSTRQHIFCHFRQEKPGLSIIERLSFNTL
jgi:hypothetical protein